MSETGVFDSADFNGSNEIIGIEWKSFNWGGGGGALLLQEVHL